MRPDSTALAMLPRQLTSNRCESPRWCGSSGTTAGSRGQGGRGGADVAAAAGSRKTPRPAGRRCLSWQAARHFELTWAGLQQQERPGHGAFHSIPLQPQWRGQSKQSKFTAMSEKQPNVHLVPPGAPVSSLESEPCLHGLMRGDLVSGVIARRCDHSPGIASSAWGAYEPPYGCWGSGKPRCKQNIHLSSSPHRQTCHESCGPRRAHERHPCRRRLQPRPPSRPRQGRARAALCFTRRQPDGQSEASHRRQLY